MEATFNKEKFIMLKKVFESFKTLEREDQQKLQKMVTEHLRDAIEFKIRPGAKVKFTTRRGVVVEGTVIRRMTKNVRVKARVNRYGYPTDTDVTWTVAPQLLVLA